jgi:hypothetical protein
MGSCITFLALDTDGPRITLILPPILSDHHTGMPPSGMRGIEDILVTGKTFTEHIHIGWDTGKVAAMTGNFMKGTIVARAGVGIKDSIMMANLPGPSMMDDEAVAIADDHRRRFIHPL